VTAPARQTQEEYYRGIPTIPYDLVKEIAIALVASLVLIVVLAGVPLAVLGRRRPSGGEAEAGEPPPGRT